MLSFSSTRLIPVMDKMKKLPWRFFLLVLFISLFLSGCTSGVYHTVKPGQTLYRISHTYRIDEDYLARVNGIGNPSQLSVGTRIFVPGARRVLYVPVVKTHSTSTKKVRTASTKKTPKKSKVVRKTTSNKPAPKPAKKRSPTSHATTLKTLQWPLKGKVLKQFSSRAKPGSGHGIEIAARAGSTVRAAEAGKVIYSGDGVNGYAFLVIVQHENNLFTVYGFNRKNLVKQGDFVSRGEKIALSGTPPAGGQPRLHFEVRKGKKAVNPMNYLPR